VLNPSAPTLPERFWDKAALYPSGCLVWQAALNSQGYGQFVHDGRTQSAHRLAYVEANGPIPDGLQIDHLCRVRSCVNPEHLEAVTASENNRRKPTPPKIVHRWTDRWGSHETVHTAHAFMQRRCAICRAKRRRRT
jgi:hypothetical protein